MRVKAQPFGELSSDSTHDTDPSAISPDDDGPPLAAQSLDSGAASEVRPDAGSLDPVSREMSTHSPIVDFTSLVSSEQIEDSAFSGRSDITKFAMSSDSHVRRLGQGAFTSSSLVEATIPRSVEAVGTNCFRVGVKLINVIFENGSLLREIGPSDFARTAIQEMTIPQLVSQLPDHCFSECRQLYSVRFEAGTKLEIMQLRAFWGCVAIRELDLPDSLKVIGKECFAGCSGLSRIRFGSQLQRIEALAFFGCRELSEFAFPGSLEYIDPSFARQSGIDSISFTPESTHFILLPEFSPLALLDASGETLLAYFGQNREVKIPAEVKVISMACFAGCPLLQKVDFAAGTKLERIDGDAFSGCSALRAISIPDSVTVIGPSSFADCSRMSTIKLPDGLLEIAPGTFARCTALTTGVIPRQVRKIGRFAYSDCRKLRKVTFSPNSSIAIIEEEVFKGCIVLKEMTLSGCSSLKSIVFPASLEHLLQLPPSLETATFEPGSQLLKIEASSFEGFLALRSIRVPASVQALGEKCFAGCTALNSLTFEKGSRLERIEAEALTGCSSLTALVIPASAKALRGGCFSGSGLRSSLTFESGHKLLQCDLEALFGSQASPTVCIPLTTKNTAVMMQLIWPEGATPVLPVNPTERPVKNPALLQEPKDAFRKMDECRIQPHED
jgi:hypothetical protein